MWVSIGQIGSALGILIGIRALTEFVPPQVFGGVTLLLGCTALALGTIISPVTQAALIYYPQYSNGRVSVLRSGILHILAKRVGICLLAAAVAALVAAGLFSVDVTAFILCAVLLILDGLRAVETVFLNAARRQAGYAVISIGEAFGRPMMAIIALRFLDTNATSVLMAYAFTSAIILCIFYCTSKPEGSDSDYTYGKPDPAIGTAINRYSLPLTPMAALGWVNGVGDRYLIGSMLGLGQAGIYSAVYGLMSRPFIMISGIVELTLRPLYNRLVAEQKHREAAHLLAKWLLIVSLAVGAAFAFVILFDKLIIKILLAEKYRSGISLMAWISGGYALLALSDVYIKVCYAYGYTGRILMVQAIGAVVSLTLAVIGIKLFGLIGAAMAVPVYFGLMLLITIMVSRLNIQKLQKWKEYAQPL